MIQIDIDESLFKNLKEDYETAKINNQYHKQFIVGFDYVESLVKLFATLVISVVKERDEALYTKLIQNDFQLHPSLGNFINLINNPFSNKNKKLLEQDVLYSFLYQQLVKNKKEGTYADISAILDGVSLSSQSGKKIKTTKNLLIECVTKFRNKTKGHGASFREDDKDFRESVLEILDVIIQTLEIDYRAIIQNVAFFTQEGRSANEKIVSAVYQKQTYSLVPIIAYIGCEHTHCLEQHLHKLFFYNGGKESKPEFLDHSFSHCAMIKSTSSFHRSIATFQSQIIMSKRAELLSDFVGRENEIQKISDIIEKSESSLSRIYGKPGIGKSAFLTHLEERLHEKDAEKSYNTFIFYAMKEKMNVEEDVYFFGQLRSYFEALEIKPTFKEGETLLSKMQKLFHAYEKSDREEKLVLMIDGLDEFSNPIEIMNLIPFDFSEKIHLILSYREFEKIVSKLDSKEKESKCHSCLSLELGKLSENEVEALLGNVIPREIDLDSVIYSQIIQTITKHTEGIPLYIHFVAQKIKEIKKSKDLAGDILAYTLKLPKKLENFYAETFVGVAPLAREILYVIYLSKSGIELSTLYEILAEKNDTIDEVRFEQEFFNSIEIFLKYDKEGNFVFYHLSVKEAILEYQKEQGSVLLYDTDRLNKLLHKGVVNKYEKKIQNMLYIKSKSTFFKVLQKTIAYTENAKTTPYSQGNYIHLLNTRVWKNIYSFMINYDDMKSLQYESMFTSSLNEENKKEIQNFFKELDTKKTQKYRYEIRYGYELAFLIQNYERVLRYKDDYENVIQELFLEIALNIDKCEYIEKFIEYKSDWLESLDQEFQDVFINIINQHTSIDDSFSEVLGFLDNSHRCMLVGKVSVSESLKIAKYSFTDTIKSEAVVSIVSKTQNRELFFTLLEMVEGISGDTLKLIALKAIAFQTKERDVLEKISLIAESLSQEKTRLEVLALVASQMKDRDFLLNSLLKIEDIYGDLNKAQALESIVSHTQDREIFTQALQIVDTFNDALFKVKSFILLASKAQDKNLYEKAFKLLGDVPAPFKVEALRTIVSYSDDREYFFKSLMVAQNIEESETRLKALAAIASQTQDEVILNNILILIDNTEYNENRYNSKKSDALATVANQMQDTSKSLLIAQRSILDYHKFKIIIEIASKTHNVDILREVLSLTKDISKTDSKRESLISIITQIQDVDKLLDIAKKSVDDRIRATAFIRLFSQTDNKDILSEALVLIKSMIDPMEKAKSLAALVAATQDTQSALSLAKEISESKFKIKALASIVLKAQDRDVFQRALAVAEDIPQTVKTKALVIIAAQMKDEEILSFAFTQFQTLYDSDKRDAFVAIVSQTKDRELLSYILSEVEKISTSWHKASTLCALAFHNKDRDFLNTIVTLAKPISNVIEKAEVLLAVAIQMKDEKLFAEVFDLVESISSDDKKRVEFLCQIARYTKDSAVLEKITDISVVLSSLERVQLSKALDRDSQTLKSLFYKTLSYSDIEILDTLAIVETFSSEAVLNYFGVRDEDKHTFLKNLRDDLLNIQKSKADKMIKHQEFNLLKDNFLKEKKNIEKFINIYGESLEIEDIYDYEDMFVLKRIEKILKVL